MPLSASWCAAPAFAQRALTDPRFKLAEQFVDKDHDRLVRETIQITEIEAPPFKEEKRAKAFAEMLKQSGLADVHIDAEGNVIGVRERYGEWPIDRHRCSSGHRLSGRY